MIASQVRHISGSPGSREGSKGELAGGHIGWWAGLLLVFVKELEDPPLSGRSEEHLCWELCAGWRQGRIAAGAEPPGRWQTGGGIHRVSLE